MVERVAGSAEAKLLAAQGIRSLYSFLNTEDVFEILSISCSALNDIKGLVCLKADDDTYIVKLGCRASIQYLYQLLKQKHEEILKVNRMKFKQNQQSQSQISVKTITILSKIHRKMTRHYLLSNNHQQRQQQQQQKKITPNDADELNSLDEYELTDDTTSQAVSINELAQGSASSITIGHSV
ncbi:unnamed protein product, partial [Rotaria socialis]